jgi:ATP-dependent Clp protease ATP-binding subunit ClpA
MKDDVQHPKFTDRFCEAMKHAEREVRNHNQTEMGLEHLLLGILDTGGGVAIRALAQLHVTPGMLRVAIEERAEKGPLRTVGYGGMTSEARDAMEAATNEAVHLAARGPEYLGSYTVPYIGTEHLLLGILLIAKTRSVVGMPPSGVGAALGACNISRNRVYTAICQCLRENAAQRQSQSSNDYKSSYKPPAGAG